MAVSIDTVYQKVLALANKEQRGYITPQDFNLFASQAQLEIFEQYFYDLNQARKATGNDTVIADIDDILEQKLSIFEHTPDSTEIGTYTSNGTGGVILPDNMHRILFVGLQPANGVVAECELLNTRDFINSKRNPLTKPSQHRPTARMQGKSLQCNKGGTVDIIPTHLTYIRKPQKPEWTYVVVNRNAMYSANMNTADFELHASEEIQLVNKILKLAGLAIQHPDVMKAGGTMEGIINQQQPKI